MNALRPGGVVVLGMHRSGTSLLTSLLHRAGLSVGREPRMRTGGPANPKGFWEVQALTTFDESVLRALDGEWSAPPPLDGPWMLDPQLAELRRKALPTFRRWLPDEPWVWKDPRLCLLTPFWTSVGVPVAAGVLCLRHPLEVAASLEARNGLDTRLGLALWERHQRGAVTAGREQPTLVTTYDTVLRDPLAWTEAARRWLLDAGVALTDRSPDAEIAAAIDGSLRHAHHDADDLLAHPDASPELVELYRSLTALDGRDLGRLELPPPTPWMDEVIEERRAARAAKRHEPDPWRRRVRRSVLRSFEQTKHRSAAVLLRWRS